MTADLLWLQTCYYFGDQAAGNRKYDLLDDYLDLITDLAPHWKDPYYFAAILLPMEAGAVDQGLYFLEKGLAQFPREWQFWFFKGMYYLLYKKDLSEAGNNIQKAALIQGAPKYLGQLSATLASRSGQSELARHFIHEALDSTDDPEQRQMLKEKFEELFGDEGHFKVE